MFNAFPNDEREPLMKKLIVLGIGSPFGDDQLGWEIVKLLKQKQSLFQFFPDKLFLDYCDRPGVRLLELMKPAQTVFLIDAIKTGDKIGSLHIFKNQDIENMGSRLSTHAIGIAETMKIGAAMHELPENVILYGIEIGETPCQFNISKPIQETINKLSNQLEKELILVLQ